MTKRTLPRPSPSALLLLLLATAPAGAQTLEGVVEGDDGLPVDGALVALFDAEGIQRAGALTDAEGRYRLEPPGPGEYVLGAERLGYSPFRSHLLAIGERPEPYRVDIELLRAPVPLEGLVVTAERREAIQRELRLLTGVDPRSLRNEPIFRDEIQEHLERGRSLPDMLRWSNIPGMVVRQTDDGICFEFRRSCLALYLNGMRMDDAWSDMLPLEMAEAVVIVQPNESIQYGGAILVFTAGWIR